MARVLVTGAGGFVGNYIARYLTKQGHEVTGTMRQQKETKEIFSVFICDLAEGIHITKSFDLIVHCAGSLPQHETDFRIFKRNNIDATDQLIKFALQQGIYRVVNMSTIGIYGEISDTVVTEETNRVNPDAYGMTKYVAECMFRAEPKINCVSLRMPGIIGLESYKVWLTNTVEKFLGNEDVKIYSPNFKTGNFVWIDDLAKFVNRLLQMKIWKYDVINIACVKKRSIIEIVNEIRQLTNSSSKILIDDQRGHPFCLDASRAVNMGYQSLDPLEIVRKYILAIQGDLSGGDEG